MSGRDAVDDEIESLEVWSEWHGMHLPEWKPLRIVGCRRSTSCFVTGLKRAACFTSCDLLFEMQCNPNIFVMQCNPNIFVMQCNPNIFVMHVVTQIFLWILCEYFYHICDIPVVARISVVNDFSFFKKIQMLLLLVCRFKGVFIKFLQCFLCLFVL